MLLTQWPFSPAYHTPNYSNMAFQLLGYAIENITGQPFPDLIRHQLIEPLNLQHTFLSKPGNQSNNPGGFVVTDGWDLDFGDESPYVLLLFYTFFFNLNLILEWLVLEAITSLYQISPALASRS
jgi:CubicO group peptidase (beta-lactamase class C family)